MVKIDTHTHRAEKNGLQAVRDRGMAAFRLSGGNVPDAVEGRFLLESIEK
jgi:hypothetical protein